ncbi:hypothetical protein [Paludisphaera rhizosphaerae]|uniref:hypothetical protein n=1 Tax=Paludisphaera rhizosphaerae TaxID=2711216 RepID=UPI001F0F3D1A|nr:hypothetical protein [Paludisphaera rhizosphaerae]
MPSAAARSSRPMWVYFAVWRMSAWRASSFASMIDAPDRTSPVMCECRPAAWKSARPSCVS